jgi:hypothetical protein
VLDRESTFAHPGIVKLLKTRFIPVAIDQAFQRRQQDTEGDFYRKIAGQGPRSNFQGTTQGFYIATPAGKLLLYNNNRDPEKVERLMNEKLAAFAKLAKTTAGTKPIKRSKVDPKWNYQVPTGGLIVRVHARVLSGYEPTTDRWKTIFQSALSRDNLWISKAEHAALVAGEFPPTLAQRMARFHLVDNTRGEPPMWKTAEIRELKVHRTKGVVQGAVRLKTEDGKRGYDAQLRGHVESKQGKLTRFDVVVVGDFWGAGHYTGGAPKGKFPLGISLTLADGTDIADAVRPQGSRGWVQGYIQ